MPSSRLTSFSLFSISLLIFSQLFYSTEAYTMLARSPENSNNLVNHGNSNQQSMRQKLTPSQQQQQPEEENIRDFCTLTNFQNCISELWPGSGGGGTSSTTTSSPAADDNKKKKMRTSSGESSSAETTTSSQALPPLTSSDLAFPTSYRELQATCSDLKERVRCLDRHSERCFTPEMMQVFGHIVTNAKQFVHDLCDNKRVQTEFLIHAKCFRNISLDEQKCAQEYRDAISIPSPNSGSGDLAAFSSLQQPSAISASRFIEEEEKTLYESMPTAAKLVSAGQHAQEFQIKELIMRRSCCALQELVHCKRRHVREQCGEAAAIFMRDHLPRITNPVLEQHCSAYTYGPGTCDEALYRRRVGSGDGGGDGQHLVATNPYHNPFDRGSQRGSSHEGSNRMIRNQLAEMHNGSGADRKLKILVIVFFFCIIFFLEGSAALLLSSFSLQMF